MPVPSLYGSASDFDTRKNNYLIIPKNKYAGNATSTRIRERVRRVYAAKKLFK